MAVVEVGFSRAARSLANQTRAHGRSTTGATLNYEYYANSQWLGFRWVHAVAVVIPPLPTPQQIDSISASVAPQNTTVPAPGVRLAIVSTPGATPGLIDVASRIAFRDVNGVHGALSDMPFGAMLNAVASGITVANPYLSYAFGNPTPWPSDWTVRHDAYYGPSSPTVGWVGGVGASPRFGGRPGAGLLLAANEGAIILAGHVYNYEATGGDLSAGTRTGVQLSLAAYGGAISEGQYSGASAANPEDEIVARAIARFGMRVGPPPGVGK